MSDYQVPAPDVLPKPRPDGGKKPPHDDGRWGTIRYAIDSWGRTFRLCLIYIVMITTPAAATVITSDAAHAATTTKPACVLHSSAEPVELLDGAKRPGEVRGCPTRAG